MAQLCTQNGKIHEHTNVPVQTRVNIIALADPAIFKRGKGGFRPYVPIQKQ